MKFRTLLLGLSALFVAFNAAFFSVSGLSKLFAGASFAVMLMASSLELAKLITAGYLYNYWEKINKVFRIYLSIGVVILVLITSLGIYGFLTAAFQDTFNVFSQTEKQRSFLEQKEKFYEDDVARYDEELKRISDNIGTLSNAKSQQIQVRDTSVVGGVRTTISTAELRLSQNRISVEEENRKSVQEKREVAADSLQTIQLRILDLDTDSEIGSELGPLQYLSGLLDRPMDQIINWFILIIIFVFDPLAVALVIAFNNAVKVDKGEKDKKKIVEKRELYGEEPDKEESDLWDNTYDELEDETWDTTLEDGLEDEPWDGENELGNSFAEELEPDPNDLPNIEVETEQVLPDESRGFTPPSEEFNEADLNKDGIVDNDEARKFYESTGWKNAYNGQPFYTHPWFDWSKRERWINDRTAIKYWMSNRGGSQGQLEKIKEKYPTDFSKKTY